MSIAVHNSVQRLLTNIKVAQAKWSKQAYDVVISEAEKILDDDYDVDEFIMAMGACVFTAKSGGKYDATTFSDEEYDSDRIRANSSNNLPREFAVDFFKMVDDLDEVTGVMGMSVRLKRNTEPIYVW